MGRARARTRAQLSLGLPPPLPQQHRAEEVSILKGHSGSRRKDGRTEARKNRHKGKSPLSSALDYYGPHRIP